MPSQRPTESRDGEKVRLRLVVAYDGTHYQGWQTQKIGQGIQAVVENALRRLFPGAGPLEGSSRTDAGVHALGLVAHVDVPLAEWRMTPRKLVLALNAHLPVDIRVTATSRTHATFHARFDAVGKQYRYRIWNASAMNPLIRDFAWHVPRPLALEAMREAARHFVGRHDFASLTANPGYSRATTERTITGCAIGRRDSEIVITIKGSGFLYKMCRGIVGTLVQVGLGRIAPKSIPQILSQRDRRVAGMTAPALGLVLWNVRYRRGRASNSPDSEHENGTAAAHRARRA